jgi:hypothetical protein
MILDKVLLERIRNNDVTLTSLEVRYNHNGDTRAIYISNALKHNTTLTSLDLLNYQISAAGAKVLSDVLRHNDTLTSLNLYHNQFGDAGVKDISDAVKTNTTLILLQFEDNQIGDDGAKDLSEVLKLNTTLISLDLADNIIGNAGAKNIIDALGQNDTLTSLNLGWNKIDDAGAKEFSDVLRHNATLTSLNLKWNQIGDTSLKEIDALMQRNNHAMKARQQQFIYKIILLACNAKSFNNQSLWTRLTKDTQYLILQSLNFKGEAHIGKTTRQVYKCSKFIFENSGECDQLIKDKQPIKLVEKENVKSNYLFHFFKSSTYHKAKKLNKISINQYTNQADFNKSDNDTHNTSKPGS